MTITGTCGHIKGTLTALWRELNKKEKGCFVHAKEDKAPDALPHSFPPAYKNFRYCIQSSQCPHVRSHSLDIQNMICVGIDRKCRLIYCYFTGQPIKLPGYAVCSQRLTSWCSSSIRCLCMISRPFSKPGSLLILSAVAALACIVLVA